MRSSATTQFSMHRHTIYVSTVCLRQSRMVSYVHAMTYVISLCNRSVYIRTRSRMYGYARKTATCAATRKKSKRCMCFAVSHTCSTLLQRACKDVTASCDICRNDPFRAHTHLLWRNGPRDACAVRTAQHGAYVKQVHHMQRVGTIRQNTRGTTSVVMIRMDCEPVRMSETWSERRTRDGGMHTGFVYVEGWAQTHVCTFLDVCVHRLRWKCVVFYGTRVAKGCGTCGFIAIDIKCKAEIYTRAWGVATKAKLDRATCVGGHKNRACRRYRDGGRRRCESSKARRHCMCAGRRTCAAYC